MKTLPKTIYVRLEDPGKEAYLVADTVPDGVDGDLIGKYDLVEVGRVRLHPATMETAREK